MIDPIEFYEMFLVFDLMEEGNDTFFPKYEKYMKNVFENHKEDFNELIKDMPYPDDRILWLKNKIRELKLEKINELLK